MTRPVEFQEITYEKGHRKLSTMKRGVFHRFGMEFEEFEDGIGNYSTAIIEDSNGKLHNVAVELVRFLDTGDEA